MQEQQQKSYGSALAILVTVFFFWGFIAASNSIFIPFCKNYFNLSQFESQLIGTAFYGAYFIGSLILYVVSEATSVEILNKIGFKNGIIYGLLISIVGALLMIPAVNSENLKPIEQTAQQIKDFKVEQKFTTSDKLVVLKKETAGYSLTIKNDADGQKFINNPALASSLNSAFTAPADITITNGVPAKLSATFSDDKVDSVVNTLKGESIAFGNFGFIITALFVIALGFSLQQTAANPFAVLLGDPATGTQRLNLGGSVNSFGTTLGPLIVSFFLFGTVTGSADDASVSSIKTLYMIVAGVFALVAIIFAISKKLPSGKNNEPFEKAPKASKSMLLMTGILVVLIIIGQFVEISKILLLVIILIAVVGILLISNASAIKNNEGWGAMKYPQLVYGMMGIFIYVGVEVTIDNNLGALLKVPGYITEKGLAENMISKYTSLYWGSLMIGRWVGAISVFKFSEMGNKIAKVIVPLVAFAVVLFVNHLGGNDVRDLYPYIIFVVIAIISFFYGQDKPVKTLLTLAILGTVFMLIGIFTKGHISVFSLMAGGLCNSIMWPSIFALGISGLGKYTGQGAAFLIMMILGGAIIPPLQGALGDVPAIGMHNSYWVAALCYVSLTFLAIKLRQVLKKQGLDFDSQISATH